MMQQVLLAVLAVAALAAVFVAFSGVLGPSNLSLLPSESAEKPTELVRNQITLEIGSIISWNGAPVDLPVVLTGQPQELEFVIKFPAKRVRVSKVESSANWKTWITRSNERGEITVRAKPLRFSAEKQLFLVLQFRRIEMADAPITIPRETVVARFSGDEPYEVKIVPGEIKAPHIPN
jgi:hypothetical protein